MQVPTVLFASLGVITASCATGLVVLATRYDVRLRRIENDVLGRLALIADFKHPQGRDFGRRLAQTTGLIAHGMGLPPAEVREIRLASQFCDIGHIALPDALTLGQRELTEQEVALLESHTLLGAELLSGGPGVLDLAAEIALSHHERWDGSGYPHGLSGVDIPLAGRVVAVADVFHTRISERQAGRSVQLAVAEIEQAAGRLFDPAVVDAFSRLDHHSLASREP